MPHDCFTFSQFIILEMDRQAIRFENRSSAVLRKKHKSLLFYFKRLDLSK